MSAAPGATDGVVRVAIVDDQALLRSGLRVLLERAPGIEVVGEAADGAAAVELVQALAPDVVLMDVRMPVLDGIEATRQIAATSSARVLVLTTYDLDEHVDEAVRAGASGFLLKSAPPAQLAAAIRAVAEGGGLLAPEIVQRMVLERRRPAPPAAEGVLARLTEREREVLRLVAKGLSNAELAGRLHVSEPTVKTHINRLLRKLEVRDRIHAVVLAYESGVVQPGEGPGDR